MPEPVSTIRNLGPASDKSFAKIGITTADQLREIGADAAYKRLLENGTRPHFIGYYALVMGLQGRPWNDCQGDEKAALRKKFDTLKGTKKGRSDFETALDRLGVRSPD
ncbi:MAG: TfoX/Sxy family protein [Paracoccaceae bacterium]